jgi:hypothetical protein
MTRINKQILLGFPFILLLTASACYCPLFASQFESPSAISPAEPAVAVTAVMVGPAMTPVEHATAFVEAASRLDIEAMKAHSCPDFYGTIDLLAQGAMITAVENIVCEQDGNNVTCSLLADGEEQTFTFIMQDGLVCGIEGLP